MSPKGHGGSREDLSGSVSSRAKRRRRNGTGSGSQGTNRKGNCPTGRSVLHSGLQTSYSEIGFKGRKRSRRTEEKSEGQKGSEKPAKNTV
jgi:hypothetical protein